MDIIYRVNGGALTLLANQTSPTNIAGTAGDSIEVWLSEKQTATVQAAPSSGITIEGSTTTTLGSGTGTEVKTIPGTPAQNDIVLVLRACDSTLSASAISGYTLIGDDASGGNPGYSLEYKRMGGTPDTTVTIPQFNGFQTACIIMLVRGVDTTTAIDASIQATVSTNTNSLAPPSITTVTNNAMVVACSALDDDAATAVNAYPTGYSNTTFCDAGGSSASNASIAVATKIVATAGTESPGVFTWNNTDNMYSMVFALRPA